MSLRDGPAESWFSACTGAENPLDSVPEEEPHSASWYLSVPLVSLVDPEKNSIRYQESFLWYFF
jgi:hypothetical protein